MQAKDKLWSSNFLEPSSPRQSAGFHSIRRPRKVRLSAALAGCSAMLFCSVPPVGASDTPPTLSLEGTQEPTAWTILYKGQKVMVYSFAPQKFKPYVKELCTLKGDNILRDAPHDHLHHHGLMYAIKVNEINFWEEVSGNGVEKVVRTTRPILGSVRVSGDEFPRATLSQVIHWLAPQDAFLPNSAAMALLVEHRTLALTIDPPEDEIALEWKSVFEVGGKTNTVTLSGATYHGLGVRFREDLDPIAQHSLAGLRPDLANKRQDVSVASWASVSFAAPGPPATLVLAGYPANAHGVTTYFSMLTPFAYLSATQGLDKEPLVYHAGDKFEMNYVILLCSRAESKDRIEKRLQAWIQRDH
jgi:hypothetical protein